MARSSAPSERTIEALQVVHDELVFLRNELKRLSEEQIVIKTKIGFAAWFFGVLGGLAGTIFTGVIVAIIVAWLKLK